MHHCFVFFKRLFIFLYTYIRLYIKIKKFRNVFCFSYYSFTLNHCTNRKCLSVCFFLQQRNLEGYVGFANLPNQVYRKSVKRGFEFTLMVVGKLNT